MNDVIEEFTSKIAIVVTEYADTICKCVNTKGLDVQDLRALIADTLNDAMRDYAARLANTIRPTVESS